MRENARTRAMLFELIVVVLFLALSSTTLLRLFAVANSQSRRSEAATYGMLAAQDALERLIAGEEVAALEERISGGRTYEIATEVVPERQIAGTLLHCAVRVRCEGAEVAALDVQRYRPERSAP